jgi:chromatin segregation and condensation protein Rec8/ScpA/Scc1 (kleisin family)
VVSTLRLIPTISTPAGELSRTLEALLVVAAQPLSVEDMANAAEVDAAEVEAALELLRERRDLFFRLGPAPLQPQQQRKLAPQAAELLAASLRRLAVDPPQPSTAHMALRFPPVAQFVERWRALLRRRTRFDFDQEVDGLSRVEVAVAFLALLELRKQNELVLEQASPFAPIRISRPDEERNVSWNVRSA